MVSNVGQASGLPKAVNGLRERIERTRRTL